VTPFYIDPLVTLLRGDCVEVMASMPADSVDAICTDPPYGLEFMGKEWDRFGSDARQRDDATFTKGDRKYGLVRSGLGSSYGGKYMESLRAFQAWCEQWGREALRVTKPGGYLLAFGGTRTHHRLVCALEDAGWIIRDELDWIYASGFPKGKANLKPAHEPIVLARKPGPLRPLGIDECRIGMSEQDADTIRNMGGFGKAGAASHQIYGSYAGDAQAEAHPSGRWPSNVLLSDPELFDQANSYVVGSGATSVTNAGTMRTDSAVGGYHGTPSRPSGTVLSGGDSGGYSRFFRIPGGVNNGLSQPDPTRDGSGHEGGGRASGSDGTASYDSHRGVGEATEPVDAAFDGPGIPSQVGDGLVEEQSADLTGYPSAFIVPKSPRHERNRGLTERSSHPTVKPIDLMRHLVRLVTPVDGVVLDPFLGSGTTCLAASEEGFRSIGIEQSAEYLEIAKGRLMATPMGFGLDTPITGKKPPKTHPDLSKHQPKRRAPGENWSGRWAGSSTEGGVPRVVEQADSLQLPDDEEPAA
jgi:DNA modification methylase